MKQPKRGRPAEKENPKLVAKRARDRANHIREKQREGKPVSDEELQWLEAYRNRPGARGVRPGYPVPGVEAQADPAPDPAPDAAPDPAAPKSPAPDPAPDAAPDPAAPKLPTLKLLPPLGDLPPPPRVARPDQATDDRKRKRWQDDYTYMGASEGNGRESACVYLGSLWHGVLKQMSDSLAEAGIDPVIKPDDIAGAIVLTIDHVLPPEFALTPEIVAVGGSSALLVQRFVRRDQIARARAAKELATKRDSRPVAEAMKDELPPPPPPEERAPPTPPPTLHVIAGPEPDPIDVNRGGPFEESRAKPTIPTHAKNGRRFDPDGPL